MKAKKMLLLLSMSLTAIAFAAPAVAQANVFLTEPAGTKLKKGAPVTATSTNLTTTTAAGTLACAKVTLHYVVDAVSANSITLKPVVVAPLTHNGTTENCHLITAANGVTHVAHISNAGTGNIVINTWGTANVSATFTSTITLDPTNPANDLHCTFTGNVHVQGAASGTDVINIGPSVLAGAPTPPCPPTGTIQGTATLETPNGTPILLDFVKTP